METLWIYARVSTAKQEKKYSLPRQIELGETYARDQGYTPVVISEAKSGKNLEDRKEWQKVEKAIRQGDCKFLWVINIDRLTRSGYDAGNLKKLFIDNTVAIIESGLVYDLRNDNDSVMWDMKAMFAEYERRRIIARTKDVRKKVLDSGRYLNHNILGYDLVSNPDGSKRIEVNEEEAVAVRAMFSLSLEGHSQKEVARRMNALGYHGKSGSTLFDSNISRMLRYPYYVGMVRDSNKGLIKSTYYPALVSLEEWEKVAGIKRHRLSDGNAGNFNKAKYALSSILACGECGAHYFYNYVNRKNGTRQETYRHLSISVKERSCSQEPKYIQKAFLNNLVKSLFMVMFNNWGDFETYFEANRYKFGRELMALEIRKKELEGRQAEARQAVERLLDLAQQGILDGAIIKERMAKLQETINTYSGAINKAVLDMQAYSFSQNAIARLVSSEQFALFLAPGGGINNEAETREFYIARIRALTLTGFILRMETVFGITYLVEIPKGWFMELRQYRSFRQELNRKFNTVTSPSTVDFDFVWERITPTAIKIVGGVEYKVDDSIANSAELSKDS